MKTTNNFFEIFSLPVAWEIDGAQLDLRFRKLQGEFHPDRYANKSDIEKRLAMQMAATINQAYQTLVEPLSRAQYLMELKGFDANQETHVTSDSQFLMNQMLMREALADAKFSEDPLKALASLSIDALENAAALHAEFAQQYHTGAYNEAFDTLAKMQFATKFVNDIAQLEAELEDL